MKRYEIAGKRFDNGYYVSLSEEWKRFDNNPHCIILRVDTGDGEVYEAPIPFIRGEKVTYMAGKYLTNGYNHYLEDITEMVKEVAISAGYSIIYNVGESETILDHSRKIAYRNDSSSDKIVIYREFDSPEEARYFTIAADYLGIGGVYIGNMKDINEFARFGNKEISYHKDFHRELF